MADSDILETTSSACLWQIKCKDGLIRIISTNFNYEEGCKGFEYQTKLFKTDDCLQFKINELMQFMNQLGLNQVNYDFDIDNDEECEESNPYIKTTRRLIHRKSFPKDCNIKDNNYCDFKLELPNCGDSQFTYDGTKNVSSHADTVNVSGNDPIVGSADGKDHKHESVEDIADCDLIKFVENNYTDFKMEHQSSYEIFDFDKNTCSTGNNYMQVLLNQLAKESPFKCGKCGEKFARLTFFESHFNVVHNTTLETVAYNQLPVIKCGLCDKVWTSVVRLKAHLVRHSEVKPYRCDGHCDKSFRRSHQLKRHMLVSKAEYKHKCTVCGKILLAAHDLRSHMTVHSTVKLHQCAVCGKSFTRSSALVEHDRRHSSTKAYRCVVCNKSFRTPSDVKKHQPSHDRTRARNYPCFFCEKTYLRSNDRKRHVASRHSWCEEPEYGA